MRRLIAALLCLLPACLEPVVYSEASPSSQEALDGPYVRVEAHLAPPSTFSADPCVARRVALLDAAGQVYPPPSEACESFVVRLHEGQSIETITLVVEGAPGGYQVAVTPVPTL